MAEGDYEVGYRKPPRSGQFPKGKSGNPGGKRKRPLNMQEEILQQLARRVQVPTGNGKTKTMPVRVGRDQLADIREVLFGESAPLNVEWSSHGEKRSMEGRSESSGILDAPRELSSYLEGQYGRLVDARGRQSFRGPSAVLRRPIRRLRGRAGR